MKVEFSKDLDLTPQQQEILAEHHQFFRDLVTGAREAETKLQIHFVDCMAGKELPMNEYEMAYWKCLIRQCLTDFLPSYHALACGKVPPESDAEVHFLECVEGKEVEPGTIHERAYQFWLLRQAQGDKPAKKKKASRGKGRSKALRLSPGMRDNLERAFARSSTGIVQGGSPGLGGRRRR
jgi:uncharacterized protein YifE (UPF0438 family)